MYHVVSRLESGGVYSYNGIEQPDVAGYAEIPGGPLTVFWRGTVTESVLREFVVDASQRLPPQGRSSSGFATIVSTDHDERQLLDPRQPIFPSELEATAGFVRFEWRGAEAGKEDTSAATRLVVWGRLDEHAEDEIDSIGVFAAMSDIKELRPAISVLIQRTTYSQLEPTMISEILGRIETDLTPGR